MGEGFLGVPNAADERTEVAAPQGLSDVLVSSAQRFSAISFMLCSAMAVPAASHQ